MFLNRIDRLTASCIVTLLISCGPKPERLNSTPDCAAVGAREQRQHDQPFSRPRTYNSHVALDTAPIALTETKGCVLARWIARVDSATGQPPESLGALLRTTDARGAFPTHEWREDGWHHPFGFSQNDSAGLLWSRGPDGRDSTGDEVVFRIKWQTRAATRATH